MQIYRNSLTTIAFAIASATAISQAQAEDNSNQSAQNGEGDNSEVRPIDEWNYDELYQSGGIRADRLMDTEVFGPDGEEIGSVENVLISADNQIAAIIAQVGGFWDIGDTHVAVPWEETELTGDGVEVPVTEDNVDDYGLFDEAYVTQQELNQTTQVEDDLVTGPRTWKLSDLVDDYASIEDGTGYGYVTNVLFTEEGEMQAVVIESSGDNYEAGAYAYPFHGYEYGWQPGYTTYDVPYSLEDVKKVEVFDYDEYDSFWN